MDAGLIGRERKQAQLRVWVTEALAGRGSLVLLGGEAGVGKTTLVQHSVANSGLQVLEGFAVQGGTSAFGPIVEALRPYLRAGGEPTGALLLVLLGLSCRAGRMCRFLTAFEMRYCCGQPA
jgi:hypothetical protein